MLSEVEEQKVQPQAALPQDTQHSLLGQDNLEDEEEDTKSSEEDDDDDSSVDYTMTDKGKEVAYDIINPAVQQISQEYETSRQESIVQPSPINPAKKTLQVLEEALQGIQVLEDTQEQGIPFESGEAYQSLLDKSAQRTTRNWIDYYKPLPIIIKALKEQNSNVQKEFTNWYQDNQYPDHNVDTIFRTLSKIINEHSDQYRTSKITKLGPSGLEKLTSKVTDVASSFATNVVAPALLGDLYPKTTKQPEIQHTPATPDKRKQSTTAKKLKTLLDAPNMATRTMRSRTQTEERQHRRPKEDTPQPPGSYPKTNTRKGNRANFKRDRTPQIPMVQEYSQDDNNHGRDNPNSDPGDSSEPGSDDDCNMDDDARSNDNSGTRWTPIVENLNQEDRMVSGNKRPKVPTPLKMNADTTWSTAHQFDNWVQELLDYMSIHNIDTQDPNKKDEIAYTNGYLEGIAKELMRTWRLRMGNRHKSLMDFLNDLRTFCVPSTDKQKIWEEFAQVKQTVNGVSRPIQVVANELKVFQMRVAELSPTQLYM